ncbi:MAG TPA: 50S ribosomal protein L11 methyltransferase [Gemmatimonadota bacterium]|nr:50S ribosomal protein L11 methyltransferase [Gemmatimonadota bacterium]
MTHVELAVAAPAEAEDTVAAVLAACGTTGAWIPAPGDVRAYFRTPSPDLERRFASHWRRVTGEEFAFRLRVRPVPDEDWLAGYRAAARPIRIGDRLWIAPPDFEPDAPGPGSVVRIEPGLGFGTGDHPTTRALLRWIHDAGPFRRALDVGTGSGVLALAALARGAETAIALDPDRLALENAARNRELNRARGLALVQGSLDALAPGARFDLVLANLDGPALDRLLPALAGRVAPGGRLGVAGALGPARTPLLQRSRAAGLVLLDERLDPDPAPDDVWWSAWLGRA